MRGVHRIVCILVWTCADSRLLNPHKMARSDNSSELSSLQPRPLAAPPPHTHMLKLDTQHLHPPPTPTLPPRPWQPPAAAPAQQQQQQQQGRTSPPPLLLLLMCHLLTLDCQQRCHHCRRHHLVLLLLLLRVRRRQRRRRESVWLRAACSRGFRLAAPHTAAFVCLLAGGGRGYIVHTGEQREGVRRVMVWGWRAGRGRWVKGEVCVNTWHGHHHACIFWSPPLCPCHKHTHTHLSQALRLCL